MRFALRRAPNDDRATSRATSRQVVEAIVGRSSVGAGSDIAQRDDGQLIDRRDRSLGRRVVGAKRFDRVADELEPDRLRLSPGGKDVEDAAADRRTRRARRPDPRGVKPASISSSPRSAGAMSWPGLSSIDAPSSRSGALTRGSSAAADATITRAVPRGQRVERPGARGGDADVRRHARDTDRLRATETAGPRARRRGPTALRAPRGRSATSATVCSRSPSPGTTYSTTPCGIACAAAATYSAFAAGVRPETARAGASMPLRGTALFSERRADSGKSRSPRHPRSAPDSDREPQIEHEAAARVKSCWICVRCASQCHSAIRQSARHESSRRWPSSNNPLRPASAPPARHALRRCRGRRWRLRPSRRP